MARFINPFPQYITLSGAPNNGGFLKFFITGTNTAKNVFSDSAFSTSIGNEIRLSGSGRIPTIFLNGAYAVTLTDPDGNELDSADPIGVDTDVINFDLWGVSNTYNIPDVVRGSDDLYYQSMVDTNLGNDPTSTSAFWNQFYFLPSWNTVETYDAGQLVIASDDRTYQSQLGSNQGNDPTLDSGTNWQILLQQDDILTTTGIIVDKIEAGTAGVSYVSASNERWNWLFDASENLSLQRFNSSGVLQDAVMLFNNSTGALTQIGAMNLTGALAMTGALTVNDGNVKVDRDGEATALSATFTSDASQQSVIVFQDATVDRWILGQTTANAFQLSRHNASGVFQDNPIQILDGASDVQLSANLQFTGTSQGIDVTSASASTMDFNFSGASSVAVDFAFFDDTITSGDRHLNVWKGNTTNAITLKIDAETGSIHPAYDRRAETDTGVKLNKIILSTDAPSGGEDGDLWLRY